MTFDKWAKAKGMLIDRDENGAYKSLETRAYAATWKDANADLLDELKRCLMVMDGRLLDVDQQIKRARAAITKAEAK